MGTGRIPSPALYILFSAFWQAQEASFLIDPFTAILVIGIE